MQQATTPGSLLGSRQTDNRRLAGFLYQQSTEFLPAGSLEITIEGAPAGRGCNIRQLKSKLALRVRKSETLLEHLFHINVSTWLARVNWKGDILV